MVEVRLRARLRAAVVVLLGLAVGLMEDAEWLVSMASRGILSDIRNLPLNSWVRGRRRMLGQKQ